MNFKDFKSQVFAKRPDVKKEYDTLSTQDASVQTDNERAEATEKPAQENTTAPVNREWYSE